MWCYKFLELFCINTEKGRLSVEVLDNSGKDVEEIVNSLEIIQP